jgi:hypothetical protein
MSGTDSMKYIFKQVGMHNGHPVLYTEPAAMELIRTRADFTGFCALINQYIDHKWYWIVNCRAMGLQHILDIQYVFRLYKLIKKQHANSLVQMWLFNLNPFCHKMLIFLPEPRACHMPTDRLELLVTMQQEKATHALTDFCLDLLKAS